MNTNSDFQEPVDVTDIGAVVDFTQRELLKLLVEDDLTIGNKLKVLQQISHTALTSKKIKVEDASVQNEKELAILLHKTLNTITTNPYHNPDAVPREHVPPELPAITLNPDETLVGLSNLTMDDLR
jgi:hypothetical protein